MKLRVRNAGNVSKLCAPDRIENQVFEDVLDGGGNSRRGDSDAESQISISSKRQRKHCPIERKDEQGLIEWIRDHEILWNRSKEEFRNRREKEHLWSQKAQELGIDSKYLTTWYESLRTRYGRLRKKEKGKSGDGRVDTSMWTDRDKWVLESFKFLSDFVGEVPSRTLQSVSKCCITYIPYYAPLQHV